MKKFEGIIAYPVTPFTANESATIDTAGLTGLVDRLVTSGVHAIAPLGSTGEAAYLDEKEFDTVVDTVLSAVDGRVPVIVGASDLTTANTIRRARYAEKAGADAVMVLPMSYWKLSEREIIQHYTTIAASIDIPIMAYNNPATSGVDMRPELLVTMFDSIDNLTMVKESTGDLSRMHALTELGDGRLPFYNGSNPLVLDALQAGAAGWCTAAPCLVPQPCLDLYAAVRDGDLATAARLYETLRPLLEFIVAKGLPAAVKSGLETLGTGVGEPRAPQLSLDHSANSTLRALLAPHQQSILGIREG